MPPTSDSLPQASAANPRQRDCDTIRFFPSTGAGYNRSMHERHSINFSSSGFFNGRLAGWLACLAMSHAWAQQGTGNYTPQVGQAGKDVIWVPTPDQLQNSAKNCCLLQRSLMLLCKRSHCSHAAAAHCGDSLIRKSRTLEALTR